MSTTPGSKTRRVSKVSLPLTLLLINTTHCAPAQITAQTKTERIDQIVRYYHEHGYLNGAVLVGENGRAIYEKGTGEADFASHTPNTPLTRFGIRSITKQFTALLVLQEVDKGRLGLGDVVAKILPSYRNDTGSQMTIEQLLHHTSGLPADFDSSEFSGGASAGKYHAPEDFAKQFCEQNLSSQPGTIWNYSSCRYILLGLILKQVTGAPCGELLHKCVLDPQSMKNTGVPQKDYSEMGGAIGYKRHAGPRYTRGPYLDLSHCFSAGAMYSTIEDLFLWNQALTSSPLMTASQREQIFRPRKNSWGYGVTSNGLSEGKGLTRQAVTGHVPR